MDNISVYLWPKSELCTKCEHGIRIMDKENPHAYICEVAELSNNGKKCNSYHKKEEKITKSKKSLDKLINKWKRRLHMESNQLSVEIIMDIIADLKNLRNSQINIKQEE